mgnify:CR=1 FL=1
MNEKEALVLLKKYSSSKRSFNAESKHVKAVQKLALEFAEDTDVDKKFIKIASLLHDIGRFNAPPGSKNSLHHGINGSAILRKEGLNKFALIAERHLGAGISKLDIKKQNLNLPMKNYLPKTKEEKIITCADNLIFGQKRGNIDMAYKRFFKELGKEYAERVKKLYKEVLGFKEQS